MVFERVPASRVDIVLMHILLTQLNFRNCKLFTQHSPCSSDRIRLLVDLVPSLSLQSSSNYLVETVSAINARMHCSFFKYLICDIAAFQVD